MSEKEINEILALLAKKPEKFRKLIEEIFINLQFYLVNKGKTCYNLTTSEEQLNYIKNCIKAYSKKDGYVLKMVQNTIVNTKYLS
jgi:hypothetical protein